ncbi:hypothetical protein D6774_00110 [Candidatus Woesearchaeota archaeon]|jgi:hypothetical protein|nr:MAG: hypothetical protein D6774_00110 [Candidatus Woesearchaeota archaeon]
MLFRIACIVLLVGIPLFVLLPKPTLEQEGILLNASVVDQIRFEDASIVFLTTRLRARMESNVTLPSDVSVLLQCANNRFSILEVYG